jgi:shikimate dehydrogenase
MSSLRFAVIGNPVSQSKSPAMHAAAYRALGMSCTYEAIRTRDEELRGVVERVRTGDLAGVNVTVPHKARVLELVDDVEPSALAVRAANTLVREGRRVVAHNTDVPAIEEELLAQGARAKGSHALVLGTGATARSAIHALARLGASRITVRGRAVRSGDTAVLRAELARAAFGGSTELHLEPFEASPQADREMMVVVQATSLGMPGGDDGRFAAMAVDWPSLPPSATLLDVVYSDAPTAFVVAARARELSVADGRGMLARQGARAFELWTGRPAPVEVMRGALAD